MLLINLLLIALVFVALFVQLITPLILNIPIMAFCLIALLLAIWHFKRSRVKGRFPIFATFTLAAQSLLFLLSIVILVAITIPHESAQDTPELVLGIRKFLASKGLMDPPRERPKPGVAAEKAAPVTINAPDAAKVEIKIEGDTPPAAKDKPTTP